MTKILGISGLRGAGKSTSRNYILGQSMLEGGVVSRFTVDDKGQLIVPAVIDGEVVDAPLDVDTPAFRAHPWPQQVVFPLCQNFSFAYELRIFLRDYLSVPEDMLFGEYDNKNKETNLDWETCPGFNRREKYFKEKSGKMVLRDVMEFWGGLLRQVNENVWLNKLMSAVRNSGTELAVVDDVRYVNEVNAIKADGGKVIRLSRQAYDEILPSEHNLMPENYDWSNFDAVIPGDLNIGETNGEIHTLLQKWGYLASTLTPETVKV